jgi:cephalosporin hydroxylase
MEDYNRFLTERQMMIDAQAIRCITQTVSKKYQRTSRKKQPWTEEQWIEWQTKENAARMDERARQMIESLHMKAQYVMRRNKRLARKKAAEAHDE